MQNQAQYHRNPDFIHRTIADESILVPIHQDVADMNCIYTLNELGAFIWERLSEPKTKSALQTEIMAEYEAAPDVLNADLSRFLDEMEAIKAVEKV